MSAELVTYGGTALIALVAGAGGLSAMRLRRPKPTAALLPAEPETDQFIDAEIDLASVRWAEANGQPPQAASLMAERLKTLHTIGTRKGWFE